MIIPDANLLLYAYDAASPFHTTASKWWRGCLTGRAPVGLCPVVLFAFVRIGTSRRAFEDPLTIEETSRHVRSWMEMPSTRLLPQEESDVVQALDWLVAQGMGGNLTTDAQIAATALRTRAEVHTADTDFSRFPGVKWINPLLRNIEE